MKKQVFLSLGTAALFCAMAFSCSAQGLLNPEASANPNKQEEVKTIFSFKSEIALTDEQENKIKALLYDEQSLLNGDTNTLKLMAADLSKLIEKKEDMAVIKSRLEDISRIQVGISCRNIEDSRKVEAILSPVQLKKWQDIQKAFSAQTKPAL